MSIIPYCNSDIVIKVPGKQVGSLLHTLYDCHASTLQVGSSTIPYCNSDVVVCVCIRV